MKNSILKTSNWIYGLIIGLLGFSQGCKSLGGSSVEYGQPHADYKISGRVTDASNNPIKNIEVNILEHTYDGKEYSVKKINTDDLGKYIYTHVGGSGEMTFSIKYTDTDGVENGGEFENMTQDVEFKRGDFTGGDGDWYAGEATKNVNTTLTLKESQKE